MVSGSAAGSPRIGHALDALALIEARQRGDGEAAAAILGHADQRAVCTVLADIVALYLSDGDPECVRDVLAELGRLRLALVAAQGA